MDEKSNKVKLLDVYKRQCQLHSESRQSAIHFFCLLMCAVYRNRSPTLFSCLCVQPYLLISTAVRVLSASFVE